MPLLRTCSTALANALAAGNVPLQADLFVFTLLGGTVLRYTTAEADLTVSGNAYSHGPPFVSRSNWKLPNTMVVPQIMVLIRASDTSPNLKTLAIGGYFDGATCDVSRLYMPTLGDTTTYGTIDIFSGDVGQVQLDGSTVTLTVKGRNNKLDVNYPRNTYQPSCNNTFCDSTCTLSAASFTTAFTVGASPSTKFIPWSGTPPSNAAQYAGGKVTFTSGANIGIQRTIAAADNTGLTLVYPLGIAPTAGDAFSALLGCDKTLNTCAVTYSNITHFRGYPFIPTPESSANGSF